MLKIHQFFSLGVLGVLFGMGLFLGGFFYIKEARQEKEIAYEKLSVAFEVVDISILEGSFDSMFLKDLQRRTHMGVVIFDKQNQKTYFSDEKFATLKLDFSKEPAYKKLVVDKQAYLVLFGNDIIDDRPYGIGVFLPETSRDYGAFWIEFMAVFGVFLAVSVGLIFLLKKGTQNELDKIVYLLSRLSKRDFAKRDFEKKDFENMSKSQLLFKEFAEISRLINKLASMLQKQDKSSKKHSKKLRLKYLQSTSIIATLSHEFKNPLAVISGYCEAILNAEGQNEMGQNEMSEEQRRRFLNKIHSQSLRLNQLLCRLNLAVRLENDLLELQKTSFDLKPLVTEVVLALKARYSDKKIITKLKNAPIQADKMLLQNVIENLVENALKYSKSRVEIVLKKNAFIVIDDGCGIEEKQIGLVTKKFYRLEQKHKESSLGLGLFIVKYILKLHHSELLIKSTPQKGSRFGFEF
ncbi:HAMP domain-containing sensor histidine kinase [Helicobacter sp. 11S02596-1]|uniref:sensor histidine kinase n=1 Tax=Helicobacter sp. 11S02596-1 TaxID=1476194 RepID=UPI000BCEFDE7|nr:HAMP domain-containing sensor histidine kinase [Helicobacter sp. 11S02596-1]PAF43548.1 hypothetical protein BJI48_04635 [Helicobacter sp. 11S02596-1]